MKTVGILGGGQLGLMLANSIYTLGGRTIIYDPDPSAPASKHTDEKVTGSWQDYDLIKKFVSRCDVVTYEFENVEVHPLRPISEISPIYPSLDVLQTTQNRISEKRFLENSSLPHVGFDPIETIQELQEKVSKFPMPFVIKIARGGYDGKGQYLVRSEEELGNAVKSIEKNNNENENFQAILEEFISIDTEVSCIVARQKDGNYKTFPVFENTHNNHILDTTIMPAKLPQAVIEKVSEIAIQATEKLGVIGLLTTEFFVGKNDDTTSSGIECGEFRIFINEFAPRPHNSGHITRNACHTSQFDALAEILLDMPLTSLNLVSDQHYCMINLLGDTFLSQDLSAEKLSDYPELDLSTLKNHENVSEVVLYGKMEARQGRKMGHLVCHGSSFEAALKNAQNAKYCLSTAKSLDSKS